MEVQNYQNQTQSILKTKVPMLYPLTSKRQYKSVTRKNKVPTQHSTAGTTDEALLQAQLLKECARTKQLIQNLNLIQKQYQKEKESPAWKPAAKSRRRDTRNPELSPQSLRRKYLPRNPTNKSPRPHPAAAATAAATQAQPPQTPLRPQVKATQFTTANRSNTLTPFRPGFEYDTEKQLSIIFCRPMRHFSRRPPFLPLRLPLAPRRML